jgi:hypothetical protein
MTTNPLKNEAWLTKKLKEAATKGYNDEESSLAFITSQAAAEEIPLILSEVEESDLLEPTYCLRLPSTDYIFGCFSTSEEATEYAIANGLTILNPNA